MNRLIRHPLVNVLGISGFTGFYSVIFLLYSEKIKSEGMIASSYLWQKWQQFLLLDGHKYIAYLMIVLTVIIVLILFLRHKPYDEYYTNILVNCLVISVILSLMAIAIFFVVILIDSTSIVSKFTFFVSVNWVTVVLADLIYLLICGRK